MMGIYRIRNLLDGCCYVGSSVNIEKRWKTHKRYLKAERHPTPALQKAWDKDGEEAFIFEIAQEVKDKLELWLCESLEMERQSRLYNTAIMNSARLQRELTKFRERLARIDSIDRMLGQLTEQIYAKLLDRDVGVFACLDCSGLHRLITEQETSTLSRHAMKPYVEMISREETNILKREVAAKMARRNFTGMFALPQNGEVTLEKYEY